MPSHRKSLTPRTKRVNVHLDKLARIFPHILHVPSAELWRRLRRLEAEAHTLATKYSSVPLPEGYVEKKEASILHRLDQLLRFTNQSVPVFLNFDPRGYALKIDSSYMRQLSILSIQRDWGGYGILVPKL